MIKSEAHSQHEIIDSVNAKLVQALGKKLCIDEIKLR